MSGDDAIRRAAERCYKASVWEQDDIERIIREELGDVEKLRAERDEAVEILEVLIRGYFQCLTFTCGSCRGCRAKAFLARVKP